MAPKSGVLVLVRSKKLGVKEGKFRVPFSAFGVTGVLRSKANPASKLTNC